MREKLNAALGYIFVISGAACWGVTGLFVQQLYSYDFSPWQVVAARLTLSTLLLLIVMLIFAREYLKVRWKDFPYLFALGALSIALFNWFYFAVMDQASIAIAVVFVYTSPVFAALIAKFLYNEKLTLQKNIAIVLTILGCSLAIGLIPAGATPIAFTTVLLGLAAGLFAASYSLLGKFVSGLYHPLTITFYALLSGSIFSLPASGIWEHRALLLGGSIWVPLLGISIISTIFAYVLFTLGLKYVESSKAAILSSVELVISVIISVYVLNEILTLYQAAGFVLVIISIVLTVISFRRRIKKKYPGKEYSWSREY
ncbi:DMT family transporter [Alkalicoccus daliensis]|uniref:Threonine/homoserine efflux transporter RhtA n=1 Tax=Alkalicoccus daliensis TaxID=745820 RepID=A0A1H0HHV2_9BACI|nr:DMT family transporter [Alkalicoccus daliensis]SDO18765.1 Threonine/homoserine efflux transporter RhtA [Alkalicoccus daliensis]